jgi:subtilisin family serine protease
MSSRISASIPVLAGVILGLSAGLPPARGGTTGTTAFVVRIRGRTNLRALAGRLRTEVTPVVPEAGIYAVAPPPGALAGAFAMSLQSDPSLLGMEPNGELDLQIHVGFDGDRGGDGYRNQDAYTMVGLESAQRLSTGDGVRVAVLDTGVFPDHPALAGHLAPGYNAIFPTSPPLDVADGKTNAAVGHGTMVCGLIARMAPNAVIIPVRVLDGDGTGSLANVLRGVRFALQQHAQVINISFGTPLESAALEQTLDAAEQSQAVIVASAGNDGSARRRFPACLGGSVDVASVDANLHKSFFSNYGRSVALVAPGSGISAPSADGAYAIWSGTSVAAPFVASAAALMLARNPRLPGDAVADLLRNTARPVDGANPRYRGLLGKGLLDMGRAVAAVKTAG